nr:hypothetical protein [Mesorhizobium sp.]
MPTVLTIAGIPLQTSAASKRPDCIIRAARQDRQEWRGKSRPCASTGRTIELRQKFQKKSICGEKSSPGMAAMQLLHCTILTNHLYSASVEGKLGAWDMGFFTEMFARPRPQEQQRYRSALALLNAMSNADRADIGIKPADFPRIAREMSIR